MKKQCSMLLILIFLCLSKIQSKKIQDISNDPLFKIKKQPTQLSKASKNKIPVSSNINESAPLLKTQERSLASASPDSFNRLLSLFAMAGQFQTDPFFTVKMQIMYKNDVSSRDSFPSDRRLEQTKSNLERFRNTFLSVTKAKLKRTPAHVLKTGPLTKAQKFEIPKGLF